MSGLQQAIETNRPETLAQLRQVFIRHAIDNRGLLTSARRASAVSEALYDLFGRWLKAEVGEAEIEQLASTFAQQGMALVSGMALLRELTQRHRWLNGREKAEETQERLTEFPLLFLEQLSYAREKVVFEAQEAAQHALQRSLTLQLQQQELLRREQEQRGEMLRQLLELNSDLAQLRNEQALLDAAVSGLCRKLELVDVTIYSWASEAQQWSLWTTTASHPLGVSPENQEVAAALQALLPGSSGWTGEYHQATILDDGASGYRTASLMPVGAKLMGVIMARASRAAANIDDLPLFIKTFATNLSTLWRNLTLFLEVRDRAREQEILHGRYVDSLWNSQDSALYATVTSQSVHIERTATPNAAAGQEYPLLLGEKPFGILQLPEDSELSPEQQEFLQALLREMGNALNNAQLLQATRAYSTQLQVAAEVSRAASTILQREDLMRTVVSLIQSRFGFSYTGLFMQDEDGQMILREDSGQTENPLPINLIEEAIFTGMAQRHQPTSISVEFPAELALPLRTRDRMVGALAIQHRNALFSQQDINVLQSLADQLATAIENATLFQRVQDNLSRSDHLYEAGRRLTEATNAQIIFQTLVDYGAQSDLVDMCHTLAEDLAERDNISVHALWKRDGQPFHGMPLSVPRHQYSLLESMTQSEFIMVTDGQVDERLNRDIQILFKLNRMRAAVFIPLQRNNQWYGTLVLERMEARPLTIEELQPFITLCDQATAILANQQLLRETGALYRISRTLNQAISQEDALALTVAEIAQYTGIQQCRVVLVDKKSGRGRVAAENMPTHLAEQDVFTHDDWRYRTLNRTHQPLLIRSEATHLDAAAVKNHLQQFGAKYSLLIPLVSQLETIGWISLDAAASAAAFTPSNLNFIQTLADQLTDRKSVV